MKKKFIFTIILSALAIVSCNKKENETRIFDQGQPDQNTGLSKTDSTFRQSSACFYWRRPWEDETNCQNNVCFEELCYMTLGCEEDMAMVADVYIDPLDDRIHVVRILNQSTLPDNYSQWFVNQIQNGYITINYDSPIEDEGILNDSALDYIPSGTYPIYSYNGNIVIKINY